MELSYSYNWEAELMTPFFDPHSEVADALLGFLDSPLLPIDTLFQKDSEDDHTFSFPADDFYLERCPKHPRRCSDVYAAPPPPFFHPTMPSISDFVLPLPPPPPPPTTVQSLSVQSAAARERRKRISEKTQELSRLIPGGSKMNTAEMLQAAHKYVKFLQAQVGILGLLDSGRVECKGAESGYLEALLASPTMQEKLSAEEKCIVPKEMVAADMEADSQLESWPLLSYSMANSFASQ